MSDRHHRAAMAYSGGLRGDVITTRWVLAEVANGLAAPRYRKNVAQLLRDIESDPDVRILERSDELYRDGLNLYEERPDKDWSLTDCISFVVMEREGLREALTGDRHFEQAGFQAVFAR